MKAVILALLFNLSPFFISAQSLIANGDFEEINICSEFRAKCAPEAWFRIPSTDVTIETKNIQRVYEGKHSEAIILGNKNHPLKYRVFLYTMLLCPLEANAEYNISFYINPIYEKQYQLGILFTETELISGLHNPLIYTPQIIVSNKNQTWKDKKSNWRKIEVTYTAKGGEQFLIFGNFNQQQYPFTKKTVLNSSLGDLAFLLDKIELEPTKKNPITCEEYDKNKALLYAANHRHADKKSILTKPIQQPIPSTDSIVIDSIAKEDPLPTETVTETTFEISDVAFDFDSHKLKKSFFHQLDSILLKIQNLNPRKILILGHSDNVGNRDYNLKLSKMRALSVKNYIISRHSQYQNLIKIEGLGEQQPKVDNLTEENRAKNRRVEIILE